jgi:Holliday junction resolvasome RuvABC endonuclease subunit
MTDFESLEKELTEKAEKTKDFHVLVLDMSSTCTGWTVVGIDMAHRKASFDSAGCIWFPADFTNQEKYHYMYKAVTEYFNIIHKIDYCVAESYMINPKRAMGCLVSPEMHGALQVSLSEIGVKYQTMPVQTWRKILGIKPTVTFDGSGKKSRDFKEPTKQEVLKYVSIPEQITSNITQNTRTTPSDLYDSLAIALGFLKGINIKSFDFSKLEIQAHSGQVQI